jgi:predicted RNA-binding protein (virulence factor B family)
MRIDDVLGRFATFPIARLDERGAWLALPAPGGGASASGLRVPSADLPPGAKEGDELEVFVYLDSDDAPAATTQPPLVELGEVAFLTVADLAPFGAFVDWGLPKELLVPVDEQTRPLHLGERHPIGLYIDGTGRLAGTMRVSEMLRARGEFKAGEWVEGEAWRSEPGLGVFVILERRFIGLLPEAEPSSLARGDAGRFRIANVLADGKVELSLRRPAHEEIEDDAQAVLDALTQQASPAVGDRSSPDEIRLRFGLGKKAFKRAVGRLLKQGAIEIDAQGHVQLRAR